MSFQRPFTTLWVGPVGLVELTLAGYAKTQFELRTQRSSNCVPRPVGAFLKWSFFSRFGVLS